MWSHRRGANGPVAAASRECSELLLNGVPVQDVVQPAVLP
jgi:hypothetical protein